MKNIVRSFVLFSSLGSLLVLSGCNKYGPGAGFSRLVGNWVEVSLPDGCVAKQISAEERGGVAVLCDDGRVFH